MYEYEMRNITNNDHWLGYANSIKELKAKYATVNWDENEIIGRWYVG